MESVCHLSTCKLEKRILEQYAALYTKEAQKQNFLNVSYENLKRLLKILKISSHKLKGAFNKVFSNDYDYEHRLYFGSKTRHILGMLLLYGKIDDDDDDGEDGEDDKYDDEEEKKSEVRVKKFYWIGDGWSETDPDDGNIGNELSETDLSSSKKF
ncbi:hypothetical protein Glove_275g96 [Diversispora epigaea]|uniref:Uncharacterized protein n=1 Tax=Diversispora epigaea TaxID=1348612 RepID=A0A397I762_9GLOM|nr:hypothetical protein Glove_275g96 [Diversispora epigaea]